MNIGIYGHSIAMYDKDQEGHFINLLRNHLDATIVHSGIVQCSEERILFNLKKTKKLDLAVIFHSSPHYMFVPAWNRDISTIDKDFFTRKVTVRDWVESIGTHESEIDESVEWFEQVPNNSIIELIKTLDIELDNYSEVVSKWFDGDYKDLKQLFLENVRHAKRDETFFSEMFDALILYKKYMSHPDLSMNRFYGAMLQIDSYLKYKKIPCIHFLDREKWYPVWHTFESGPVNRDLTKIRLENSNHLVGYDQSANGISTEGNYIIFKEILNMLNAVSSIEVDAPSVQLGDGGSIPPAAPGVQNDS